MAWRADFVSNEEQDAYLREGNYIEPSLGDRLKKVRTLEGLAKASTTSLISLALPNPINSIVDESVHSPHGLIHSVNHVLNTHLANSGVGLNHMVQHKMIAGAAHACGGFVAPATVIYKGVKELANPKSSAADVGHTVGVAGGTAVAIACTLALGPVGLLGGPLYYCIYGGLAYAVAKAVGKE